jgi:sugar phosphate isomerase/epimerase
LRRPQGKSVLTAQIFTRKVEPVDRRQFIRSAAAVTAGSLIGANAMSSVTRWQIGCFNRPWGRWSFDEALDGMKEAGFHEIGLLGENKGEAFIYPEATPAYLDDLKKRIHARGLKAVFGRMHNRHDIPLPDAIARSRTQIDNAARLQLKVVMAIGVDKPEEYGNYCQVMADAAPYAKERGIQMVFKPHGGLAATADEMLRCVEKVNQPNFGLWYDAGNIIHYTGKDPVADVERVARHVTGFCAKDCAKPGGDVMIQFGDGKVDFAGVFRKLKQAGFHGPVMIECCGGQTLAEVTEKARENRLFLERLFETI